MAGQINVGDELLDYLMEIDKITSELTQAMTHIGIARKIMLDTDNYEGAATEEISLFFTSLELHMQRLQMFYQAAFSYVNGVYTEFYYTEEQLAAWICDYFGLELY